MSFKLPNFLHDGHYNALRSTMQAPLSSSFVVYQPIRAIDLPDIERLRHGGIDIAFEDIRVLHDLTLSYKGVRVLLYIRDINSTQTTPKFHIVYCQTLVGMQQKNRWARYVVANRDDGLFTVNHVDTKEVSKNIQLAVCQNCLGKLEWQGFESSWSYTKKVQAVSAFSLPEFFEEYPRDLIGLLPEHTADTAPINDYSENWAEIAEKRKKIAGYTCQSCATYLEGIAARYLHVHHVNGQKNDNRHENLRVLCIACHAEQPLHEHMKALPEYMDYIRLPHKSSINKK